MKKITLYLTCCLLAAFMLVGCGGKETEEKPAAVETEEFVAAVEEEIQPVGQAGLDYAAMEEMILNGELSSLVGEIIDITDEEEQKLKETRSFHYLLNDTKQIVSIATVDPALHLYDISPQMVSEEVIEKLLLDLWSYKAEYFWYMESDTISCYQSAVFEKDHFEYVITTNTEEDYGIICAVELIDKNMFDNSAEGENETVFAQLRGF